MAETIKKLYRSTDDVIIAGVCGGIGEYFGWDASIVRLFFVLMSFSGGAGLIVYFIMALMIPKRGEEEKVEETKQKIKAFASKITKEIQDFPPSGSKKNKKRHGGWFGWMLLILGAMILCDKFMPLGFVRELFWPIVLLALGLYLILK